MGADFRNQSFLLLKVSWRFFPQFAAVLDGVLSKLSRYDEGTFFSSILSFTVSKHVWFVASPLRGNQILPAELQSFFFLSSSSSCCLPPPKVKAAAKYVEVPVSPSICLLFYCSSCASLGFHISVSIRWKCLSMCEHVWTMSQGSHHNPN